MRLCIFVFLTNTLYCKKIFKLYLILFNNEYQKKILNSVYLLETKKYLDGKDYFQILNEDKVFKKKIKNISFCHFNSSFCKKKGTKEVCIVKKNLFKKTNYLINIW